MFRVICSKKNAQIGENYATIGEAENNAQKQKKKCNCECCGVEEVRK